MGDDNLDLDAEMIAALELIAGAESLTAKGCCDVARRALASQSRETIADHLPPVPDPGEREWPSDETA